MNGKASSCGLDLGSSGCGEASSCGLDLGSSGCGFLVDEVLLAGEREL